MLSRAILGHLSLSMLLPAVRFLYGFGLAAVLSKHLSVEAYGEWSLAISNIYLVISVASVNLLYAASMRLTGRDPADQHREIFTVVLFKFGLTILVFLGFGSYLAMARMYSTEVIALMAAALLVVTANNTIFGLLRALLRVRSQVLFFAVECGAVLVAVGLATMVLAGGVPSVLCALIVGESLACVLGIYLMRSHLAWGNFEWPVIRRYLAIGLPLIPFAFSDLIVNALVPLMIRLYDSFQSVAHYSIAQKIALVSTVPGAVINNVYMQYLQQARIDRGNAGVRGTVFRFLGIYLAMAIPVLIGLAVFGRDAVLLVSTPEYLHVKPLMLMLAAANVIVMLTGLATAVFAVYEKTRIVGLIWLGVLILYVLANLVLIPRYGPDGAVYAILASFSVGCVAVALASFWLRRQIQSPS